MTEDRNEFAELARLMPWLPVDVRVELAQGPLPEPRCRVCDAIGPTSSEFGARAKARVAAGEPDADIDLDVLERSDPEASAVLQLLVWHDPYQSADAFDRLGFGRFTYPQRWSCDLGGLVTRLAGDVAYARCMAIYSTARASLGGA